MTVARTPRHQPNKAPTAPTAPMTPLTTTILVTHNHSRPSPEPGNAMSPTNQVPTERPPPQSTNSYQHPPLSMSALHHCPRMTTTHYARWQACPTPPPPLGDKQTHQQTLPQWHRTMAPRSEVTWPTTIPHQQQMRAHNEATQMGVNTHHHPFPTANASTQQSDTNGASPHRLVATTYIMYCWAVSHKILINYREWMKWIFIHSWHLFHSKSLWINFQSLWQMLHSLFHFSLWQNFVSFTYSRCFIQYFISFDTPFQFQLHCLVTIASSSISFCHGSCFMEYFILSGIYFDQIFIASW